MKKYKKIAACMAMGSYLLVFGGCLSGTLNDVFFVLGPLFL